MKHKHTAENQNLQTEFESGQSGIYYSAFMPFINCKIANCSIHTVTKFVSSKLYETLTQC